LALSPIGPSIAIDWLIEGHLSVKGAFRTSRTGNPRISPRRKEKQLAEVSLIERDFSDSLAGQLFATSGCLLLPNTND
jgi:hypothetical protein